MRKTLLLVLTLLHRGPAAFAGDRAVVDSMHAKNLAKVSEGSTTFLRKPNGTTVYKFVDRKLTKTFSTFNGGMTTHVTTRLPSGGLRTITTDAGGSYDHMELGPRGKNGYVEFFRNRPGIDKPLGKKAFRQALIVGDHGDWHHVRQTGRVVHGKHGAQKPGRREAPELASGGDVVVGSLPSSADPLKAVRTGTYKTAIEAALEP